ncbi:MAG: hypothetical protein NPMRTH4_1710003 [Nitrosopumilales archaeon]|nr:MAG: hypothetical protein NPMRTH4_1710003 [Nitrosopumilales archaeon]
MVKPIILVIGAIPVILALLIAIPLVTQPEIPVSAVNPYDVMELEYTKHQIQKISFGVTETVEAKKSEILVIKNNGDLRYTIIEDGITKPDKISKLDQEKMTKLTALIKETGFMSIPSDSFPVLNDIEEYQKLSIKITLNDDVKQIFWLEQNATEKFVPPIITIVGSELDLIIKQLIE